MRLFKWTLAAAGLFVAGGIVAFAVVAGGGLASAQTPDPNAPRKGHDQYLAEKLGISVEQLQAAQKSAREQMLTDAVAAGRITQAQADKLKERQAGVRMGVGVARKLGKVVQNVMTSAAEVIGISKEQLRTELQSGKSLTQIAGERNVSRDALKSGLTSKLSAQIQAALAGGDITQEQATRLQTALNEKLDAAIDRVPNAGDRPDRSPGERPGGFRFRGR